MTGILNELYGEFISLGPPLGPSAVCSLRNTVLHCRDWNTDSKTAPQLNRAKTHLAHLANTACLTEGADGPHVALVPGAKLGRVVVGTGIQGNARVHVPGGLHVVALTERRETKERQAESGTTVMVMVFLKV